MGFTISAPEAVQKKGGFTIAPEPETLTDKVIGGIQAYGDAGKNMLMGAVKGAADIGTTLLRPLDATGITGRTNLDRKESLKGFFSENAEPESLAFKGGELAGDIAGTAGAGGVLAKGVRAVPALASAAPKLATALETGGFSLGAPAGGRVADMATRIGAGAAVGGASAGLINPEDAGIGAAVGGALPVAAKVAGMAGKAMSPEVAPEVRALYDRAKALGIDIPADRILNSRPLNAMASSLNYVPLSGRAATEERMFSQMNRAVSRTFGQDSDNVTSALRKAGTTLGDKFEITLKSNTVKADQALIDDLVRNQEVANKELVPEQARIIANQIDDILAKVGPNGEIDGQAAYNIKKSLDRIGNRNGNEAFYARELKKSLMGALDRSLGPQEAASFKKIRQQYGNMLDLENLAQNGAEGGISIGRLANMKNINNGELQEIADIAAQFIKGRESPHGSAQRVFLGGAGTVAAGAVPGALPALVGGMAAGRAANTALNSDTLKALLLNPSSAAKTFDQVGQSNILRALLYNQANRQANP